MKYAAAFFLILMTGSLILAQDKGADGVGDPFYPQMGNGGYDVQHYTIALAFDPDTNTIDGTTTIEAKVTEDLSAFNLDLYGLEVSSITVNDAEAEFSRDESELTVTPAEPLAKDASFTTVVAYSGTPEKITDPGVPFVDLGWQEWSEGYFAAVSEPSGAMNWFPSNNHPTDKATFTYEITVPQPNVVAANGILREVVENDDDTRTYIWDVHDLMATYLTMVAVGDFVEVTDDSGPVLIRSYFPSDASDETLESYSNIKELVAYYSELFGDYPFEAIGVVVVPGFPAALETQTLIIIGDEPGASGSFPHELAHQWFGDSASVAQWPNVWLSEGFATYISLLWDGHQGGENVYNNQIEGLYSYAGDLTAPGTPDLPDLFGGSVYVRGALVLHALRVEVGDDTFFKILRTYYAEHAYGNASSEDFIATAEAVSGQDLKALFDAWLFGDTLPELPEE